MLQILKELQDTYGVLITENAQLYEDNWGNSKYSFSQNGEGFGFSNAKELAEGLSEEKALMPEFIQLIQRYIDAKTSLDSQLESNPMFGKHLSEEAKTKKCKIILQFDKQGNFIKEYNSIKEAASNIRISSTHLVSALKGRSKTAARYVWRYKYE